MRSPFPGMDPYIEACGLWADFHHGLVVQIKCALADIAPQHYLIRTNNREYVVLTDSGIEEPRPYIVDTGSRPAPQQAESEPITLRAFIAEPYREAFIEIYEATPEQRLVTCVEVLSPMNKRVGTEGWDLYQRKRKALLLGAANFVEIDLLRGGTKPPMLDPWPSAPYTLLVCRRQRAPYCKVWPAHFQRPLPPIPVPLAEPDPDVQLNLQPMIEAIYARGRYHRSLNYTKPLTPALEPTEQAWLTVQLAARAASA